MIELQKIGVIKTPYLDWAPHHPLEHAEGAEFVLEVDPEWEAALADLQSFRYVHVLFHLDRSEPTSKTTARPPWAKGREVGLFASRSPRRPSPIGLSVVRVLKVEGRRVYTSPIDALDGTPLIDLKPYIKATDAKEDANNGWIDTLGDAEHMLQHLRGVAHDHGDGHDHHHHHHHHHEHGDEPHEHLDDPGHEKEPHDH